MKLDHELIKKIEKLSEIKLEDSNVVFNYKYEKLDKIVEIIFKKIHSRVKKDEVLEILLKNDFNNEEANQIISFSLSKIFKNNTYWRSDVEDDLESYIEEIDSKFESLGEAKEYNYKPVSFRVGVELRPHWYNIIQKIARKNDLSTVEYFRNFLRDSGFDEACLESRKENPKLLKSQDLTDEILKDWLNYGLFNSFADNFKSGLLGKTFKFSYFNDTVTGKKISFGNINNDKKELLSEEMNFYGQIISEDEHTSLQLPKIEEIRWHPSVNNLLNKEFTQSEFSESNYYKYLPLFNPVSINPFRMSFSEPDELGIDSVFFFFKTDDNSIKKLKWDSKETRFPMFPILNDIVNFFLSKEVYPQQAILKNTQIKGEFPVLIQNLLNGAKIKYLGITEESSNSKWKTNNLHTFESEYCKTLLNVEILRPENKLNSAEYYNFDVDNGLDGIVEYLKELEYIK